MDIKHELCEAFCGTLAVSRVPAGFAVGTGHRGSEGDAVGFYVVGPDALGKYRIQDDGLSVETLESAGADLSNKTRKSAFESLLQEYEVEFDEESGELMTAAVPASQIGAASLRFLGFVMRVQDLALMSAERAASTFREDAMAIIAELVGDRAELKEDYPLTVGLSEIPADLAILPRGKPPVAVFFGYNEQRVLEALLLQSYAAQAKVNCSVTALLETERAISQKMRQRAANHLDATPIFRGDERAACTRVVREALDS